MSMPHSDSSSGCPATSASSSPTARDARPVASSPSSRASLGLESLLVEPGRLGEQSALVGEVGEGRPAPQREGVFERDDGAGPGRPGTPSRLADEGVEPRGVQLVAIDAQAVAGRLTLDALGAEGAPQERDVGLDDAPRGLRRVVAPDQIDQGLGGDERVGTHDEVSQDGALLGPAEWERALTRRRPRAARAVGTGACPGSTDARHRTPAG